MSRTEVYLIGNVVFFSSLLFSFLETWYFGWNNESSCPKEMICDYISLLGKYAGLFILLYALFIRFWEV